MSVCTLSTQCDMSAEGSIYTWMYCFTTYICTLCNLCMYVLSDRELSERTTVSEWTVWHSSVRDLSGKKALEYNNVQIHYIWNIFLACALYRSDSSFGLTRTWSFNSSCENYTWLLLMRYGSICVQCFCGLCTEQACRRACVWQTLSIQTALESPSRLSVVNNR